MLTKNIFPALKKTEILPENPVSETRNHTIDLGHLILLAALVIN